MLNEAKKKAKEIQLTICFISEKTTFVEISKTKQREFLFHFF
jgi:hypothetical protein